MHFAWASLANTALSQNGNLLLEITDIAGCISLEDPGECSAAQKDLRGYLQSGGPAACVAASVDLLRLARLLERQAEALGCETCRLESSR